MIDLLRSDLDDLGRIAGAVQKRKVDLHLEALRQMETSLIGASSSSPSGDCMPPGGVFSMSSQANDNFPAAGRAQMDLMVAGLACGFTRVASLQWSHTVSPTVPTWLGLNEGHHSLSHMSDGNPQGVAQFVAAERWFAEQFRYLIERLDSLPEPAGEGTMLDNSVVLWAKEMGDSRLHVCESVPFVIAGSGSGSFTTGRYVRYQGESHNKLLVSICRAMGLENATFGNPIHGTGELDGLRGMIMRIVVLLFVVGCSVGQIDPVRVQTDDTPPGPETPVGPTLPPGAAPDPACDEELVFFVDEIEAPILTARCIGCHNRQGVAQATDLILSLDSLDNYRTAATVALETAYGRSVLLLKPSLTHPEGHTGGELVPVGSPEYARLEQFVEAVTDPACNPPPAEPIACDGPATGPRLLRRLTHSEYEATVRDLLGLASLSTSFVSDAIVEGFDNDSEALIVSPLLADQLRESAEAIATQADLALLLPCAPEAGDEACARTFIERFGKRAFRRPLAIAESARYLDLFRQSEQFAAGIRWTITAMLQSPSFLYRRELGEAAPGSTEFFLDGYEVASALSYGITGTMPDDELFRAADAGELSQPDQIAAQAVRLFRSRSGSAGSSVDRFVAQWLELDTLDTVPKDAAIFPEFDSTIREKLRQETEIFTAHVLYESSGTFEELLTADYTFVDADLAAYYGVEIPADAPSYEGWYRVSSAHQAGLITQGSFLATHSRPNDGSPIHRGVVIRERLLCQELPPPPPGVNAEPPPLDPTLTDRERYSAHSSDPACSSCHRLIDPIGFGFARFDGIGRPRQTEDDAGEIIEGAAGTPFQGTRGLASALARRADVVDCFARQFTRFAYGTALTGELACAAEAVRDAFRADGGTVESLVVALTQTSHFTRRIDQPLMTDPDPGSDPEPPDPDPDPDPSDPAIPPPPPPAQDSLRVDVRVDSDWGAGYCHAVTATNEGSAPLDWSVALDIDGTLTTHWNAEASGNSGRVTFQGLTWNDTIGPMESASFGYCASR